MSDSAQILQQRREEVRREVRRYLAERMALAFPISSIRRKLVIDGDDFSEAEIEQALVFLAGLDPAQVKTREDGLGASRYYQATSAGVLAHERAPR